ncbi:MAG TPA: bifunctional 5,10-methylenetetrahydrofolate dehydrogenase/5,10-methenyltetrahydrofolate cyclohydrolase [Bacilli bacterium]|jgi:methylenetetrahydrofolate dehydrogenase (NADP+)/methenyltetrahydrofolate cyclohydrolase|nr:bifunctional 5,10-methylenetetrahydrofolate dehydrogenase/5,10-methenyltetrahydrofolate cyclohydrolase [Bacilli bacterium]HPV54969.1 bifunctional 5,10-methylenetetrahydrofolate dehydrogenase/5,10-methenyltetrahydrofolate cyclohydrolase [Bacilli bacterium]HQM17802.1 bifunctional 5,10-methylenetetrahydrofolate dehydrogenase/5,10-methenyltetrahydrofolate cyclohydrolase [Bacilli bacterium]
MSQILDGQMISKEIRERIKEEVNRLEVKPKLVVILVGDDDASKIYVRNKIKACETVGIATEDYILPKDTREKELVDLIEKLNKNKEVNGILVQLPLPKHLNEDTIVNTISPIKDVDGLNMVNQGKLLNRKPVLVPATPKGIITLLKRYFVEIEGKRVVIVGRSKLVGMPLALLFNHANATVTVCHSYTEDLKDITKQADILVSAVGKADFIRGDMIKKDAVVVDVGINRQMGHIVGDVNFKEAMEVARLVTPVPKGVGPMTIASLLENVLECYDLQKCDMK